MYQSLKNIFANASKLLLAGPALALGITSASADTTQTNETTFEKPEWVTVDLKDIPVSKTINLLDFPNITETCPQLSDVKLVQIPKHFITPARTQAKLPDIPLHISENLMSYAKKLTLSNHFTHIKGSNPEQSFLLQVNSYGGDYKIGRFLYESMKQSPSFIVTASESGAYSIATLLLAAGDERRTLDDTKIMVHKISPMAQTKEGDWIPIPLEYVSDSALVANAKELNDWFRNAYIESSNHTISATCSMELIGRNDIIINPESWVKLRLGDVIFPNTPTAQYATVRYDDPRAEAYRAQLVASGTRQNTISTPVAFNYAPYNN